VTVSRGAKSGCRAAWRDYTQRSHPIGDLEQGKFKDEKMIIEAKQVSVYEEAGQVIE
jgi:hypothetical protein